MSLELASGFMGLGQVGHPDSNDDGQLYAFKRQSSIVQYIHNLKYLGGRGGMTLGRDQRRRKFDRIMNFYGLGGQDHFSPPKN